MTQYIRIKPGVDMSGLSPKIWKVAQGIADVFETMGYEAVITSAFRPQKPRSLHHGFALDFRCNHISRPDHRNAILTSIRHYTGVDYDVIMHGDGPSIHYHVEYDPD